MTTPSTSDTPSPAGKAHRLYVIVRGDLHAGLQLAQTAHVVRKFTRRFPDVGVLKGETGISDDENLIVLCEPDEPALLRRLELLECEVPLAAIETFREPDLGDELTALAIHAGVTPETALLLRQLLSSLPLALREARKLDKRASPDPDPNLSASSPPSF